MKQLYLSLKEAGLMFKGHTEQGEVDFILVETYENGNKTSVDVKGIRPMKPCRDLIHLNWEIINTL